MHFSTPGGRLLAGSIAKEAVRAFNTYMAELWSLRGLSWKELARRTCRKSWDDEIFGQSARLTFYFFFALFPVLLLLLILLGRSGGARSELFGALLDSCKEVLLWTRRRS